MSDPMIPLSQVMAIIAASNTAPKEQALRKLGETISPISSGQDERPVIVTTAHRGVFFGYATDIDGDVIALRAARLAVYWTKENKGFMGLASNGPTSGARIGPPANIKLRNITAVLEVSPEAVTAWESAPWSS